MNIDLNELKELEARLVSVSWDKVLDSGEVMLSPSSDHSLRLDHDVFIRTTNQWNYTGRIVTITNSDLKLERASWVVDYGSFSEALETGRLKVVQPFPYGCILSRHAILDVSPWRHNLPTRPIVQGVTFDFADRD